MGKRSEPSAATVEKIRNYVRKYWEKTGTAGHPDPGVTEAVVKGLAANIEEVGRPLCPCNFYPDKAGELQEHGRSGARAARPPGKLPCSCRAG